MGLSRQRSAQWSFRRSKTTGNELHRLIIRQSWNLAINYIHINPSEAKQWTIRAGFFEGIKASRILPIHQLLCLQPPLELLVELHKAYPDGVKQKETAYGRNPLHIACRGNASFEVIRFLVNAYPTGVQEEDSLGRVPLHYALSADMDEDTIRIILEGFPRGSTASDQRGWLPIHVACSVGSSPNIILMLIEAYPSSVLMGTSKGSNPLKCCNMVPNHINTNQNIAILKDAIANIGDEKVTGILAGAGRVKKNYGNVLV